VSWYLPIARPLAATLTGELYNSATNAQDHVRFQVANSISLLGIALRITGVVTMKTYRRDESETILIVDDEDLVRRVTSELLRLEGYTVLEASSGVDALRIASTHRGPVHALVSDVAMPEMNGQMLASRLTAAMPGLKVLYYSGYTEDAVDWHGSETDMHSFLRKPFTSQALTRKLRELLDR
jgi:CheY-like chemotaxis protein